MIQSKLIRFPVSPRDVPADQHSRDDRPRAWKLLGPMFSDVDPKTIEPEDFLSIDEKTGEATGLIPLIEQKVSARERHRTMRVWRALASPLNRTRDVQNLGHKVGEKKPARKETIRTPATKKRSNGTPTIEQVFGRKN